jgi:hypothetical protein
MDAKIDLLYESGMFASPQKTQMRTLEEGDSEEEEDIEQSLVCVIRYSFKFIICLHDALQIEDDEDSQEEIEVDSQQSESDFSREESPCPPPRPGASHIRKSIITREVRANSPDGSAVPSDSEDAQMTESEEAATESAPNSESEYEEDSTDGEEDWQPTPSTSSMRTPKGKRTAQQPMSRPETIKQIEQRVIKMILSDDEDDDLMLPAPSKKAEKSKETGNGARKQKR